ncbi:class I SAM-dependent methyltransferase [Fibrella aquatilis]|uniref:Methyltransferase domain-containing protein n=1 Tax=Fibrella aquatilis TaxID=2817059 RepID=A0A939K033_9BACT|nr:methyltransferase domain-containing protein [Fibrella aquatilis]MBO0931571.1 methyltransferase domain-containing protein [Fibrella aquatilis]
MIQSLAQLDKVRYKASLCLLLAVLVVATPGLAQSKKHPCLATYMSKPKAIAEHQAIYKPIYEAAKGEVFASVGAGSGTKEIIYSMMADSLTFYLQDIDPACLAAQTIAQNAATLYATANRANTATFIPVIGTESETKLPASTIDKLLIENSLHEFTNPADVLADVRKSLKKGGLLYVMEMISTKPGRLHNGCKKPLFTHQTLLDLLTQNGFRYVRHQPTYPNEPQALVYVFAVAE